MKREVMNSRDRVLWVIRHQEPDRILIDISAVEEVMDALIDYYGIYQLLMILN